MAEVEPCTRISVLIYDICYQLFSTELDIYKWMKAVVQGRQAIVKGLIALLWNSLVFPFVFQHFGLKPVIFQKFCGYSVC